MNADVRALRTYAVCHSLFPPLALKDAIAHLGFVQADPIRSPARAQDLILRHRAMHYRNGDIDRLYPSLDIEEDVLYAYGFMPRSVWRLLHPRDTRGLTKLENKVLEIVRAGGPMHPKQLEAHLGRKRVINAWGGYSKETTRALEDLHYRGLLRIARRENGIRIFEAVSAVFDATPPIERLRKLTILVANILAPSPEKTLRATLGRFRHSESSRRVLDDLVREGEFERIEVDGMAYIRPAAQTSAGGKAGDDAPPQVRFLAPFDPLVWDRVRFEHFWNWSYRFEAYTPPAKRIRGYYAMPLLWRDAVIGWANARLIEGKLDLDIGFAERRPREKEFRLELDKEVARFEAFLGIHS